jgi:hypothetical protein
MGGGANDSSSSSKTIPKWAQPVFEGQIMPLVSGLINNYTPGGGDLRNEAVAGMEKTASGANLLPSSNPTLQGNIDAITRSSQQYLDRNLNKFNGTAQQVGGLFGTKALQGQNDLVRQSAGDVTDKISALVGNNYNTGLGLQQQAQSNLLSASQQPLNELVSLINELRAPSSSGSSSGFNFSI